MPIFNTSRLSIKELKTEDKFFFHELLSDPEIIDPIPQQKLTDYEIEQRFIVFLNYTISAKHSNKTIWGIYEKGQTELIGLCALLTNDENDKELGYRFRSSYWGKGYGTEVTKGLIEYCFTTLQFEKITADVNIANTKSVKILENFLYPIRQFRNVSDNCTDQRYALNKSEWERSKNKYV